MPGQMAYFLGRLSVLSTTDFSRVHVLIQLQAGQRGVLFPASFGKVGQEWLSADFQLEGSGAARGNGLRDFGDFALERNKIPAAVAWQVLH